MSLRGLARSLGSLTMALGVAFALPATAGAASPARLQPQLNVVKTVNTPAPFTQGQTVTYTIVVSNIGDQPVGSTVLLDDDPGTGLDITAMTGTDWSCSSAADQCTYFGNAPQAGGELPPITVTATVATDAPSEVCNSVFVSTLEGESGTAESSVCTQVTQGPPAPDAQLSIAKSHSGTFPQGGTGTYTLTVSNAPGTGPTEGQVTVTDTLPANVTYNNATGTGWTCGQSSGTVTCTRSDALPAGASYPPITLTVNVTSSAACTFTNSATVSGGGSQSDTASDATTVSGGTCTGGNGDGDNGGGSILPINLNGILTVFNNISTNNNIMSPGATNTTNQNFASNGSAS